MFTHCIKLGSITVAHVAIICYVGQLKMYDNNVAPRYDKKWEAFFEL